MTRFKGLVSTRLFVFISMALSLIAAAAPPEAAAQDFEREARCDNRLILSWELPPRPGGYRFEPQDFEGGGNIRCSGSSPSCVVTGLKPGRSYSYFVTTEDGGGQQISLIGPNTDGCPDEITPTSTPRPKIDTCENLPADISVKNHRPFSTHCQRVSAAGVGKASLTAQGVIEAINVWGAVNAEIQICFGKSGRLKFLDTATAPRAVSDLAATYVDGMICGVIDRPGTVVLQPGAPAAAAAEAPSEPPTIDAPVRLAYCWLTTTDYLSLRGGPSVSYSRIDIIPSKTRLRAWARTSDWYMVTHDERMGWVSGDWVIASAGCDEVGEILDGSPRVFLSPQAGPEEMETEAPAMTEAPSESETEAGMDKLGAPLSGCDLLTGDIINLRAGPGLAYDILAEMPNAARLVALERADGWFKVVYAGEMGWVSADWVQASDGCDISGGAEGQMAEGGAEPAMTDAPAESETEAGMDIMGAPLSGCQLVSGDIINLRAGPGLDYDILAEIPNETSLSASDRAGDWFKVEYDDTMGWVNIDYVFRRGACG